MDKEPKKISYNLVKVTTEQFAMIEKAFCENEEITVNANIRFGVEHKQKLLAVIASFKFECKNSPFIIVEGGCHFKVDDDSWQELLNSAENSMEVPKGFLQHLSMITVGSTRGILHAKTEKTEFNRFYIPLVNVVDMVKEDVVFHFDNEEEKNAS